MKTCDNLRALLLTFCAGKEEAPQNGVSCAKVEAGGGMQVPGGRTGATPR